MDNYGTIGFIERFSDDYCLEYLRRLRFKDGVVTCIKCGSVKPSYKLSRVGRYLCSDSDCGKKFSILDGTVFRGSKVSLRVWFYHIYVSSNNKKNISSVQIGKNLGITQKTAWGIQSKLRGCMYQEKVLLSGTVEVDEAFVSKGNKWTRWGGISTRKEPILGLIERGGKLVLLAVPDRSAETMLSVIGEYVEKGSVVYTDGWYGYSRLKEDYTHEYVNHSSREYVRGNVHTNSIENVWSFLKKSVRNAHHFISNKHIQSYLDEAAFRHNNRHLTQMERFDLILSRCIKRMD